MSEIGKASVWQIKPIASYFGQTVSNKVNDHCWILRESAGLTAICGTKMLESLRWLCCSNRIAS